MKMKIEDKMILDTYKKYQLEYKVELPEIQIVYGHNNVTASSFTVDDLYDQKYSLFVNNILECSTYAYLEEVLYHEFTHVADSLCLLDRDKNSFKSIMGSYSEFHAAKIEMKKRIDSTNNTNITLNTMIDFGVNKYTIEQYLSNRFQEVIEFFTPGKIISDHLDPNIVKLFYYFGYVSVVNEVGIDYKINFYKLNQNYILNIKRMWEALSINVLDFDEIEHLFNKLIFHTFDSRWRSLNF